MNTLINQMPPALYVSILILAIIAVIIGYFVNRNDPNMITGYIVGGILMIAGAIGLIIIKLKVLPIIAEDNVGIVSLVLEGIGLATFLISGFLHNKKMGIKTDPTLKKIIIVCLIIMLLGISFLVLTYNIDKR